MTPEPEVVEVTVVATPTTDDSAGDEASPFVRIIRTMHGAAALATDGILGSATWKTFQFWSGNKLPGDMKNICGFTLTGSTIGKWVDGVAGKWTITMLQVMLNRSYAGSGKLLSK